MAITLRIVARIYRVKSTILRKLKSSAERSRSSPTFLCLVASSNPKYYGRSFQFKLNVKRSCSFRFFIVSIFYARKILDVKVCKTGTSGKMCTKLETLHSMNIRLKVCECIRMLNIRLEIL